MADPFVAEVRPFGFNFAPKGWAQCNGQLLPISQNTALFALLGTFYGGDGKSTFALPNLQASAPLATGQSGGTSEYYVGQPGGVASERLLPSEMPVHTHLFNVSSDTAQARQPPGQYFAAAEATAFYNDAASPNVTLSPNATGPYGGSQPHNNMQPYLTLNFCIAMQGVFPPRG